MVLCCSDLSCLCCRERRGSRGLAREGCVLSPSIGATQNQGRISTAAKTLKSSANCCPKRQQEMLHCVRKSPFPNIPLTCHTSGSPVELLPPKAVCKVGQQWNTARHAECSFSFIPKGGMFPFPSPGDMALIPLSVCGVRYLVEVLSWIHVESFPFGASFLAVRLKHLCVLPCKGRSELMAWGSD